MVLHILGRSRHSHSFTEATVSPKFTDIVVQSFCFLDSACGSCSGLFENNLQVVFGSPWYHFGMVPKVLQHILFHSLMIIAIISHHMFGPDPMFHVAVPFPGSVTALVLSHVLLWLGPTRSRYMMITYDDYIW